MYLFNLLCHKLLPKSLNLFIIKLVFGHSSRFHARDTLNCFDSRSYSINLQKKNFPTPPTPCFIRMTPPSNTRGRSTADSWIMNSKDTSIRYCDIDCVWRQGLQQPRRIQRDYTSNLNHGCHFPQVSSRKVWICYDYILPWKRLQCSVETCVRINKAMWESP